MAVRAIRGATRVGEDVRDQISTRTAELVGEVLRRNGLESGDVISMLLTATPDLRSAFPAAAVREAGITDVPLMCAQEIDVPGAMPRVIRLMAHVETTTGRAGIRHVYLHGTDSLRDDLDHEDRP